MRFFYGIWDLIVTGTMNLTTSGIRVMGYTYGMMGVIKCGWRFAYRRSHGGFNGNVLCNV